MKSLINKHLIIPSPLMKIKDILFDNKGILLYIKRDDLIHPDISGNKWRKLKYNLLEAQRLGNDTLVSFGGNYSNHLVALAAASKLFGFKSIGYIRGDTINLDNRTIKFLIDHDMELYPLSRTQFRDLDNTSFIKTITKKHPNSYIVPMGGTNRLAISGIAEMMDEINSTLNNYHYICTPIGSGGTASGIIQNNKSKTLVFNTFKKDFTKDLIYPLIDKDSNNQWETINGYHFGGFAKTKPELLAFIDDFEHKFNIPLEYVYNGKMMFGLIKLIEQDYFKKGDVIVAIHTGGLQGKLKRS